MAGIECSPKIFDFRANGIPVQESVDFFDTLKRRISVRRFSLSVSLEFFCGFKPHSVFPAAAAGGKFIFS